MKEVEIRKKEMIGLVEKAKSHGLNGYNEFQFLKYENGYITYHFINVKGKYELTLKTRSIISSIEILQDLLFSDISYCKFSVFFKSKEIDSYTFDENN